MRLVNTGFGDGNPWDDQYDEMLGGWKLFLRNLWLHRMHFAGRHGTPALPMGMWPGAPVEAWPKVLAALGLPAVPQPGERVETAGDGVPRLAGTVLDVRPGSLALLLDQPAPGTGIVAVEGSGEVSGVSLWVYLYGPGAPALAAAHEARASEWLARQVAYIWTFAPAQPARADRPDRPRWSSDLWPWRGHPRRVTLRLWAGEREVPGSAPLARRARLPPRWLIRSTPRALGDASAHHDGRRTGRPRQVGVVEDGPTW